MKSTTLLLLLTSGMALAFGCASPVSDTTTIRAGGSPGAPFTGYYLQDGRRVPVSGTLPFTLTHERLKEFEIRKTDPAQTLQLAAQNDVGEWHSEAVSTASPDVQGLRVVVHNGLFIEKVKN